MKLFQMSWLLGMLSYIVMGALTRSGSPLMQMSLGTQILTTFFLGITPAGIGTVLGVMSWNRKEVKAWWIIGAIALNLVMLLAGIFLLYVV